MGRGIGRGTVTRSRVVATGVLLLALVAGCSGGGGPGGSGSTPGPGGGIAAGGEQTAAPTTTPAAEPATLAITPKNGAQAQSVAQPVTVTATGGTLSVVTLRNGDGKPVKGTLSADKATWTSAEPLGYDKTYSVSASAENADGVATKGTSAFTTVRPRTFTLPYLFPGPNGPKTVGIGQPITVRFDEPIGDKAAAEKTLTVTTSPKVDGSWHWFSDQVVHWRPKNYWAPGTKVTVRAAVYGVHVGDDVYGQQDVASSFTIGRSKIATIDDRTHQMTIKVDGKTVRTAPVSLGKDQRIVSNGKTINYLTQSGPHIVAEKYTVKVMSSASYGVTDKKNPNYYEEEIPLAVRISPDGEFVHSAPWSVWAQGKQNTSHGCVNLSPANARWFYDNFSYGDVVDIRNTGRTLPYGAGYNEWGMPWSEWVAGSALK
jgi:lipoprotein-anchoring transpeptidase ErfK/SrfK